MQPKATVVTIASDPASASTDWPELRQQRRAIVVVDVVESVRLMQANEADVVDRWRRFVNEVRTQVLPKHGGRLVKSLGDGLLLEFEGVTEAVQCAIAIQRTSAARDVGLSADRRMSLRIGVHFADLIVDDLDVYGTGVNLTARLAGLAEPGEIVASIEVCDQLVEGLDANVEDLGECYLKHLKEPIRAFRVHAPQECSVVPLVSPGPMPTERTLAIIPFKGLMVAPPNDVVGELIADNVIARLSKSKSLRVVSRLSASQLRTRSGTATEVGALLGADFLVSGTYRMVSATVILMVELADVRTQQVLWADSLRCSLNELLAAEDSLSETLCASILTAILTGGARHARTLPLPTLDGFSLQLAGIVLMHRASRTDFNRGREVLEHLIERYPRAPEPRAWLAKWYVLRVTQGLVEDLADETRRALDQTHRALALAPDCSLALAMEGFVHCHMLRDLDGADQRLDRALAANPNESLAWLYKCVVQGFRNDGHNAMLSAERAIELSPLDPMRHYYDGLAASAALAVGSLDRAIELANRSLRVNRSHSPTLRALAIAQVELGAAEAARATALRILELEPGLTVRDYVARGPKGAETTRLRYASALREAGVPAG